VPIMPAPDERNRSRLEDAFFLEQDRKLIENLKRLREMEETKQALAEVSGIRDDAVLRKLVELNVRPETVASLTLVPLIEVAWASGKVDEKERQAVLAEAQSVGWAADSIGYQLLERWMTHRPGPELLDAWLTYTRSLSDEFPPEQRQFLKVGLLERLRRIAEASGGLFGLGRISTAEQAMIDKLATALD
jgi:hypothetical protein